MVKNILIFVAGALTGMVLMVAIALKPSGTGSDSVDSGKTLFATEGECISGNSFQILQVLDSGDALAHEMISGMPIGITALFLNNGTNQFYDDQIVENPVGKCAKQIGIYKYTSNDGRNRTVPIVEIRDK